MSKLFRCGPFVGNTRVGMKLPPEPIRLEMIVAFAKSELNLFLERAVMSDAEINHCSSCRFFVKRRFANE